MRHQNSGKQVLPSVNKTRTFAVNWRKNKLAGFVILLVLPATIAIAEPAREITWDDLLPPAPTLANPLEGLPAEVQDELVNLFYGSGAIDRADSMSGDGSLTAAIGEKLAARGIDVDDMLRQMRDLQAQIDRFDREVVTALDGEVIRMPGYALPLAESESGVTEFLLVPYVGACIHVPPPPPNQMVMVELSEPYQFENIYDAVWLTGELRAKASTQSLSYVDGATAVATGYTLTAIAIEPYEWPTTSPQAKD